jgi:hypothetical protein
MRERDRDVERDGDKVIKRKRGREIIGTERK